MSAYHYVLVILWSTILIVINGDIYLTQALNGGFSVELIHRDSPKSPFYNSSETQSERMANAIHRSLERVKHFYPEYGVSYKAPHAPIHSANGEYLLKFSIGTPKFDVITTLDTGSDLIWVQCKPCKKCYKQSDPIFDPSKSKTYEAASCNSHACQLVKENGCLKSHMSLKCKYKEKYMDGSFSSGDVAHETFTFGTTRMEKIIFGCGHDNQGVFDPKSGGIVGLGNGAISLTSQLGATVGNKFSYCFPPKHDKPGLLSFGEKAMVSGPGTVSTPLASGPSSDFYYINFKGMTVAGKRLDFVNRNSYQGNMLLDTGALVTYLPKDFYDKLEYLVAAQIKLQPIRKSLPGQKLCYNSPQFLFKAPPIKVHFAGADIVLNTQHTFDVRDGLMCFNMEVNDEVYVLGNTAQTNFHIGIDREKKVVSFKPTDCSKLKS